MIEIITRILVLIKHYLSFLLNHSLPKPIHKLSKYLIKTHLPLFISFFLDFGLTFLVELFYFEAVLILTNICTKTFWNSLFSWFMFSAIFTTISYMNSCLENWKVHVLTIILCIRVAHRRWTPGTQFAFMRILSFLLGVHYLVLRIVIFTHTFDSVFLYVNVILSFAFKKRQFIF